MKRKDKNNLRRLLKKLDYLPRWAWYLCSFFMAGPFGPFVVYLVFHVLNKMAQDIEDEIDEEARSSFFDVDVDVDVNGHRVHVRSKKPGASASSTTYQDEDCIVTDDSDVAARWQQTESSARRAAQKEKAATASAMDENATVADVIREGREAMQKIRQANDLIPDPQLSAQIDSIETSCGQILSILEQRPQLLPQLRTFLRYYLPTTLRLLDARARLESTANTPKARQVRARISEALGVVDKAFLKQVEALDEYRFIDLESEMDVLRDMLRADGLIDEEEKQDADPFADVLKQKYSGEQGTPLAGH